jgi:hypothetical protein
MRFIKISICFLFILSLASAGVSVYLFLVREDEKARRIAAESDRDRHKAEVAQLSEDGERLEAEIQDMNVKYENAIAERDAYQDGAKEYERAFENAQARNQELEAILEELEGKIRTMLPAETGADLGVGYLEFNAAPAEDFEDDASGWLEGADKEEAKKGLFSFFRSSQDDQESYDVNETDYVEDEAEPTPTKTWTEPAATSIRLSSDAKQTIEDGRVLLVNRNFNFVVANLGSRQGIELDDVLVIKENDAEISKVRVEKLYDDYAAAYIVEEQLEEPIQEGALVTFP